MFPNHCGIKKNVTSLFVIWSLSISIIIFRVVLVIMGIEIVDFFLCLLHVNYKDFRV